MTLSKLKWFSLLAAMAMFCGVANVARAADEEVSAEKLLPPETHFLMTLPSIPDLIEANATSSLGMAKLLNEPELQPFLDGVKKWMANQSGELKQTLGVTIEDILSLPKGEFTFAVVEKPAGRLAPIVMMDTDEDSATLQTLLEKLDAELIKNGAKHTTETIDDSELHVFELPVDASNPFRKLTYVNDDGFFMISSEPAALKSVIERYDGTSSSTLAQSEIFKTVQSKCAHGEEEPLLKWHLNLMGLVQAGIQMSQQPQAMMALGFFPVVGLDKLRAMGGSAYAHDDTFEGVQKMFICVDQPTSGLLNMFQCPAIAQAPPKWVADDVGMFAAINWDIPTAYTAVQTLVDSFQGPGALDRLIDSVTEQDGAPPIHLKKDLLDVLSGQFHIVTSAKQKVPGVADSFLISMGLTDAAKMKKTLTTAARSAEGDVTLRTFEGETIYEVQMDQQGTEVTISVAVAEGGLVATNDASQLENVLRGKTSQPLAESVDYKAMAKHLPAKTSMVTYSRSDSQLEQLYATLKEGASALPVPEEIDLSKLPSFEVFRKYLRPQGGYLTPDAKGALSVGFVLKKQD